MRSTNLNDDEIDTATSERTSLLNINNRDDENRKWILTIASLASAMLAQSYLLISVFPYSGFMAMHFIPNLNEENAGSYAGLIASSFMIGRTFTSFGWGKSADKYGRVFVIKVSLILSAFGSILFGFAPTFSSALFCRFLIGLSNGIIGPLKTLVSEMSKGDETKETQSLAIILGMWGYGFLLNPAISGYLSDPIKQYPNIEFVQAFGPLLRPFPFLLPNLVGFLFCMIAYNLVSKYVDETLPAERRQDFRLWSILPCWRSSTMLRTVSSWGLFKHMHYTDAELSNETMGSSQRSSSIPKWIRPSPSSTALMISAPNSQEGVDTSLDEDEKPATIASLWQRDSTRQHLLVSWVYSFLICAIDETFPLYCISKTSGLGVHEKIIGNILSGTGFFYVTLQYFLVTKLVGRFGLYNSMKIGTLFSIPIVAFIPLSLITNRDAPEGKLTWSTLLFLSITYAIVRAFSSTFFSTLTMALNRTVPVQQRGTMNGLCMLGGSVGKGFGPIFAGILYSTSVAKITPPYGSVVVYAILAALGLCIFLKTLFLQENKYQPELTVPVATGRDPAVDDEDIQTPVF